VRKERKGRVWNRRGEGRERGSEKRWKFEAAIAKSCLC